MQTSRALYSRDLERFKTGTTYKEDQILFKRYKQGDKKALNILIVQNLKLVMFLAENYRRTGIDFNVLVSAGNLGMLEALEKYDPNRSVKFISYAVWYIRKCIFEEISYSNNLMPLTTSRGNKVNKIKKASISMISKLEREPTIKEIADKVKLPCETVSRSLKASMKPLSINFKVADDYELIDIIPSNEETDLEYIKKEKIERIKSLLGFLSEKERIVITMYFGIGYGKRYYLEDITDYVNLTTERVRQIKNEVIGKLKHPKRIKAFKELV